MKRAYEIPIQKDLYIVDVGHGIIDLGELSNDDWDHISNIAKSALRKNLTSEVSKAYVMAFVVYISQVAELSVPFDPKLDKLN